MRRRILGIVMAAVLVLTGIPVVGTGTITAYAAQDDLFCFVEWDSLWNPSSAGNVPDESAWENENYRIIGSEMGISPVKNDGKPTYIAIADWTEDEEENPDNTFDVAHKYTLNDFSVKLKENDEQYRELTSDEVAAIMEDNVNGLIECHFGANQEGEYILTCTKGNAAGEELHLYVYYDGEWDYYADESGMQTYGEKREEAETNGNRYLLKPQESLYLHMYPKHVEDDDDRFTYAIKSVSVRPSNSGAIIEGTASGVEGYVTVTKIASNGVSSADHDSYQLTIADGCSTSFEIYTTVTVTEDDVSWDVTRTEWVDVAVTGLVMVPAFWDNEGGHGMPTSDIPMERCIYNSEYECRHMFFGTSDDGVNFTPMDVDLKDFTFQKDGQNIGGIKKCTSGVKNCYEVPLAGEGTYTINIAEHNETLTFEVQPTHLSFYKEVNAFNQPVESSKIEKAALYNRDSLTLTYNCEEQGSHEFYAAVTPGANEDIRGCFVAEGSEFAQKLGDSNVWKITIPREYFERNFGWVIKYSDGNNGECEEYTGIFVTSFGYKRPSYSYGEPDQGFSVALIREDEFAFDENAESKGIWWEDYNADSPADVPKIIYINAETMQEAINIANRDSLTCDLIGENENESPATINLKAMREAGFNYLSIAISAPGAATLDTQTITTLGNYRGALISGEWHDSESNTMLDKKCPKLILKANADYILQGYYGDVDFALEKDSDNALMVCDAKIVPHDEDNWDEVLATHNKTYTYDSVKNIADKNLSEQLTIKYYKSKADEPERYENITNPITVTVHVPADSGESGSGGGTTGGSTGGGAIGGGSTGGGSGTGGVSGGTTGGNTNQPTVITSPDGTKTETSEEIKPDGTKTENEKVTTPDGTVTETETVTTPDGTVTETETVTTPDGTVTETETVTTPDGTRTETMTETKPDGTVTESEKVESPDGTITEKEVETKVDGTVTEKETVTEPDGAVKETQTVTEADGSKETETTVISADGKEETKVSVSYEADGTAAKAVVEVAQEVEGKKMNVSMTELKEMSSQTGAASKNTTITLTAKDEDGEEKYVINIEHKNLGKKKLVVYALDKKGNLVIVDSEKNNAKVGKDGKLTLNISGDGEFQLLSKKEAAKVEKEILKTVVPARKEASVKPGKKLKFELSKDCNKKNIDGITYETNNKNIKIDKNGNIEVKKSGNTTITATITLKNGKQKKVQMKIKTK